MAVGAAALVLLCGCAPPPVSHAASVRVVSAHASVSAAPPVHAPPPPRPARGPPPTPGIEAPGVLNATAFGLDSSGGLDVTAALRRAVDAAFAANVALLLPPGRYLVSDTIEIVQKCPIYHARGDGGVNIVPNRFVK